MGPGEAVKLPEDDRAAVRRSSQRAQSGQPGIERRCESMHAREISRAGQRLRIEAELDAARDPRAIGLRAGLGPDEDGVVVGREYHRGPAGRDDVASQIAEGGFPELEIERRARGRRGPRGHIVTGLDEFEDRRCDDHRHEDQRGDLGSKASEARGRGDRRADDEWQCREEPDAPLGDETGVAGDSADHHERQECNQPDPEEACAVRAPHREHEPGDGEHPDRPERDEQALRRAVRCREPWITRKEQPGRLE